jgi:hypothetical protein
VVGLEAVAGVAAVGDTAAVAPKHGPAQTGWDGMGPTS